MVAGWASTREEATMPQTLHEVADKLWGITPGGLQVIADMYAADEEVGVWSEEGVVHDDIAHDMVTLMSRCFIREDPAFFYRPAGYRDDPRWVEFEGRELA